MKRDKAMCARLAILLATIASVTNAEAAILYDAAANTTPDAQGWAYFSNPLFRPQANQTVGGGLLSLDSLQVASEQVGYFSKIPAFLFAHPNHPIVDLDDSAFVIEFAMRQVDGRDIPDSDPLALEQRNRGGFAVIAISEDLTGIELQFQTDHVVALDNANTAFPVGEVQAFDTTDTLHEYQLRLSDDGYRLSVDGSLLLQGSLRNYSGIAPASPLNFPYTTPSFFFFGDDTGRGAALTQLTHFAVSAVQSLGDCSGDDELNRDDLSCVETIEDRDMVLAALHALPGDLDGNGEVSLADFLILSTNFGQDLPRYSDGNIDLKDGVGFADFLSLSRNFGKTPARGSAVPEPNGLAMISLGLLGAILRNRRGHKRLGSVRE